MKIRDFLFLAGIVGIVALSGCGRGPKATAVAWHKALVAGDLVKANELSTSKTAIRNKLSISLLNLSSADKKENFRGSEFTDVKVDGDIAVVTVKAPDGETGRVTLVKRDGKWFVALERN